MTAFSRVLVRSGGLVLAVVVTGGQVLFVAVVLLFRYLVLAVVVTGGQVLFVAVVLLLRYLEGCYVVVVWRVKKVVFWNV